MYTIICSDIDGTLLDKNRDISQATRQAFARVRDKTQLILASSRQPSAMYYLQEKLDFVGAPLIAYNGGLILGENGKIIKSYTLPNDFLKIILEHQHNYGYNISTYADDMWRTAEEDYWTKREINNTRVNPEIVPLKALLQTLDDHKQTPHKIMCMGEKDALDSLVDTLAAYNDTIANLYRSKDTYLEISAKTIDKSKALKILLDHHYEADMSQVVAFGDNHNDELLIQNAGYGVAVANATENVKLVADLISPYTNKEDAVAKTLNELFK